ncbi:MAG: thiolase family protein [Porticoccaceae bacterium]|nr:thiolase family protein [Pseudomonadales bacterium]MCP5172364.1 thiolase family protein [Pseudomonadales bacterium]
MKEKQIVIVGAARTPMGGMQGELGELSAAELGSVAIRAAVERAGVSADAVDELYFGSVVTAGQKQAPARQASLGAGLPDSVPCTTINKVCGSSMKAVMIAHDQLLVGNGEAIVAGGMESMSRTPYLIEKARQGLRMGHAELKDSLFLDGLEDAGSGGLMGSFAQKAADDNQITREAMDAFAVQSLARANQAITSGWLAGEIAPVVLKTRQGERTVAVDEQPGNARPEKIPHLRPAFKRDGSVTAANASSMSDGAAALVLMDVSAAATRGLTPLARIVGHATHAQNPSEFTLAPIGAIKKLLDKTGWKIDDVDLFEINEAFAVVTLLAIDALGLDPEKVNVNGGACALGHPLGASGARILVTLLYALRRLGKKRGIATLCLGGGEATAVAIELID